MPCAMELPVSMESEDSESPAAKTAAVTAVMTAEPCHTPDTVMEDRGVDLSFDTTTEAPRVRVKSELGEPAVMRTDKLVIPSENHHRERDQIKQECDNSQTGVKQESQHILQSPGGRLKIFQSKFVFFLTAFLEKVPSFTLTTTMMQMRYRGDW